MISGDLRFEGFDQRSWTNLISLFAPGVLERIEREATSSDAPEAEAVGEREREAGSLIVVVDDEDHVLSAVHSARGRVRDLVLDEDLPTICARYRAVRIVVLREGAMEGLAERLALRLTRNDEYVGQCLMLLRGVRELQEAGQLRVYPSPLKNVPVPSMTTVRRALDLVLPVDHAAVAVLWQRGRIWTAAAIRRRAEGIDLVAGPDLISRWAGPLGGDFRRDYRVVVDAVARAVAPVHMGIFTEVHTLRSLLSTPSAGSWATAVAVRDVVVNPIPPYAAVALGADVVNAAARSSARLLGGLDLFGAVKPIARYLRARVTDVASVSDTLGFNPLDVLARTIANEDADPEEEP